MNETLGFFIPGITPDKQEEVYAKFALLCDKPVVDVTRRIYSITFVHNSEEWTATVGETLRGVRHATVRSRGKKISRTLQLADPALVLAIFPENPLKVVTNSHPIGVARSQWANPFLVGHITSTVYFSNNQ